MIRSDPDQLLAELFTSADARAGPYPLLAALREVAPVHRSNIGAWVLSRFDDCQAALRQPGFGKGLEAVSRRSGLNEAEVADQAEFRREHRSLLWLDPPDHTRLRSLVARAFTPRTVEAMRPHVVALTDELLDGLDDGGEFMEAVALPLPITVVGEVLGVPPEDRPRFQPLSRAGTLAFEPTATPETVAAANQAGLEMEDYFRHILADRRARPADDLLSHLLAVEAEGDTLSEAEVISTAIVLFGAGFETTANLLGNGLLALARHPDQERRLRDDPSLVAGAIDELLRWDSPVQVNARTAMTDVEVGGQLIAVGETVVTLLGAANRDPDHFADPDHFDVGRRQGAPLSFGAGIHHCLGAALARLEGEVFFGRLLERSSAIEVEGEPRWRDSVTMRGLDTLQVRLS